MLIMPTALNTARTLAIIPDTTRIPAMTPDSQAYCLSGKQQLNVTSKSTDTGGRFDAEAR